MSTAACTAEKKAATKVRLRYIASLSHSCNQLTLYQNQSPGKSALVPKEFCAALITFNGDEISSDGASPKITAQSENLSQNVESDLTILVG